MGENGTEETWRDRLVVAVEAVVEDKGLSDTEKLEAMRATVLVVIADELKPLDRIATSLEKLERTLDRLRKEGLVTKPRP